MTVTRYWMALHLQQELELQGVRLGRGRGKVDLTKLLDAAMTAVHSSEFDLSDPLRPTDNR